MNICCLKRLIILKHDNMVEKMLEPVVDAGAKVLAKCGSYLAKESVKHGAKIAARIASYVVTIILTVILTSNWKDKVNDELNKKHDRETAEKLSAQFQTEMDQAKKEIAGLKLSKKETEKILKEKIRIICEKFGIDPDIIFKS